MRITWARRATEDLVRLHQFLASVDPQAAARVVQALAAAPKRLLDNPQLGERLEEFQGRDVRRAFVGQYEMRYQIEVTTIQVLRLWHTREQR